MKAAPKIEKPPEQKMKTHGDHISTAAVHQANMAGMQPVASNKAQLISGNEPFQVRSQLSNNMKDLAAKETPERQSYHMIGSQVAQGIHNLTGSDVKPASNFHEYVQHAMANKSGHPLVDMLDDVASNIYANKKPQNPFKDRTYRDTEVEKILTGLSDKYPDHKHEILQNYRFGKDTNISAIQAGHMLNSMNKYHETSDPVYLKAAKDAAYASLDQRVGGKHLPSKTHRMANDLIEGKLPKPEHMKAANDEMDFHMHSDPGMLSYATSTALAHHHMNKLNEHAKETALPLLSDLSAMNFDSLSPEQLNHYRDQIKTSLGDLEQLRIGGVPSKFGKDATDKLKLFNAHIERKLGLRKSLDMKSRVYYIKEKLKGGKADNIPDSKFNPQLLAEGMKEEQEHTSDPQVQKEIAKDHLSEVQNYYLSDNGESRLDGL